MKESLKKIELTSNALFLLTGCIKREIQRYEELYKHIKEDRHLEPCLKRIGELQTLLNYLKSI